MLPIFGRRVYTADETYMHRCLELARLGHGQVAPNPMVGAVLVYEGRIIGEGYHQHYGQAHAEPNCLSSVKAEDRYLISQSTLYVSLEPCAHFGKTPPCADLIVKEKIPKVVIGCRDPFPAVNGKGIERLQSAGVNVRVGVLEEKCREINKRFFIFHTQHRPFILLKWAQTADGKIASASKQRLFISNDFTNRIVHKWRSEEAAILVGSGTALADDPELTTRFWPGPNPLRLVVDREEKLPGGRKLFNQSAPTIVFSRLRHTLPENISASALKAGEIYYYQVADDSSIVNQIAQALYQMQVQSVMVEGGARLLQMFIDESMWDEARVITNTALWVGEGLDATQLQDARLLKTESFGSDSVHFFQNKTG
ncbi:MAG: bifunctional diaminohydroxyphosphoribosylaminopyrimidine deaminase/5-amino-6-(5-phosphoribosylamino)uracil reductase RibD [Flavisolibacter sp.]